MLAMLRRLFAKPHDGHGTLRPATPEQIGSTRLLVLFCGSDLASMEVSEEAIRLRSHAFLEPLSGLDYERVRNRFRILGNLDPIGSKTEDRGIIRISYRLDDGFKDAEIDAVFPPSGDRFFLKKKQSR